MRAGLVVLLWSGLAAVASAGALPPGDIPVQCARMCDPMVELTSKCAPSRTVPRAAVVKMPVAGPDRVRRQAVPGRSHRRRDVGDQGLPFAGLGNNSDSSLGKNSDRSLGSDSDNSLGDSSLGNNSNSSLGGNPDNSLGNTSRGSGRGTDVLVILAVPRPLATTSTPWATSTKSTTLTNDATGTTKRCGGGAASPSTGNTNGFEPSPVLSSSSSPFPIFNSALTSSFTSSSTSSTSSPSSTASTSSSSSSDSIPISVSTSATDVLGPEEPQQTAQGNNAVGDTLRAAPLGVEEKCVCLNDSFDMPTLAALCASCIEQSGDDMNSRPPAHLLCPQNADSPQTSTSS